MKAPPLPAAGSVLSGVLLMVSMMTASAHPPAQAARDGATVHSSRVTSHAGRSAATVWPMRVATAKSPRGVTPLPGRRHAPRDAVLGGPARPDARRLVRR
jgi:hypothetical protein